MKKIKYLLTATVINVLGVTLSANAQDSSYTNSSVSTVNTTMSNTPLINNPTALIVGSIGLVVLIVVIVMMYRNRRKSVSGIQNQQKPDPRPVTTQSINNPGAGV